MNGLQLPKRWRTRTLVSVGGPQINAGVTHFISSYQTSFALVTRRSSPTPSATLVSAQHDTVGYAGIFSCHPSGYALQTWPVE